MYKSCCFNNAAYERGRSGAFSRENKHKNTGIIIKKINIILFRYDKINEKLSEVVKFVAATHPLGQKRCRRGDACRITSYF